MDWIEQWLGFAPDNGDGTLELTLTLLAVAVVVTAVLARWSRGRAMVMRWLTFRRTE